MEKIVQDDLAELVKFESEEIDLDQINLNQVMVGWSEIEDFIQILEEENKNFIGFLKSLGYDVAQIDVISRLGEKFNQDNSGYFRSLSRFEQ